MAWEVEKKWKVFDFVWDLGAVFEDVPSVFGRAVRARFSGARLTSP